MIKGVNRQVLEVHETGTKYFEKALFFVKPEYSTLGERRLNEKALQALSGNDKVKKRCVEDCLSASVRNDRRRSNLAFKIIQSFLEQPPTCRQ